MRIVLAIEYQGNRYHGFQLQANALSIQYYLEQALSKVADQPVTIFGAGRTDKGVHASCQVIHFDTESIRPITAWLHGTNCNLPDDIRVIWAKETDSTFHARFSALSRGYHYIIHNSPVRSAHFAPGITWYPHPLDHEKMQAAANLLIGEHDFTSFRAAECQAKSPTRNLELIRITRRQDLIVTYLKANAFLHHMVRNIMGVLIPIGTDKEPVVWAQEVLAAKSRKKAGVTAAPQGLYLTEINYPPEFNLLETNRLPWILMK